jgi:putative transcriptional regulator
MTRTGLTNTLKVHRAMRDLTQQQLADLVGVSRKSINAIECSRFAPSTLIALKLARALGVPVEELFQLEQDAR